jgi:hydroxymethylpyrimidine/phosphomethylpyrimidine kinase
MAISEKGMTIPNLLSIAGVDPSGGAGIAADLKTFAALGAYGMAAVTALTVQNTRGVRAVRLVEPGFVADQIDLIFADIRVDAVKIGMVGSAEIAEAIAASLLRHKATHIVLDPVMVAKSGDRLLDDDAIVAMRAELLPRALVVTPNIPEAEVLTGRRIQSLGDAREAAQRIHDMGSRAVVVKGGHAAGDVVIDVLFDGERIVEFRTPRIQTRNTHGTGCTFASAIAAYLALGLSVGDATERAQEYVAGAIRHGLAIGHGHGPLNHFWNFPKP